MRFLWNEALHAIVQFNTNILGIYQEMQPYEWYKKSSENG